MSKKFKYLNKRFFAMLLTLVMVLGVINIPAMASETVQETPATSAAPATPATPEMPETRAKEIAPTSTTPIDVTYDLYVHIEDQDYELAGSEGRPSQHYFPASGKGYKIEGELPLNLPEPTSGSLSNDNVFRAWNEADPNGSKDYVETFLGSQLGELNNVTDLTDFLHEVDMSKEDLQKILSESNATVLNMDSARINWYVVKDQAAGATDYHIDGYIEAIITAIRYEYGSATNVVHTNAPTGYTYNKTASQTVTIPVPTADEFVFSHWEIDVTKPTITGNSLSIPAATEGTITLTAVWDDKVVEPDNVTVTFDLQGGTANPTTAVAAQTFASGGKASVPTGTFEKDGNNFVGWYAEAAGTTEFNFSEAIIQNTTVYAKWSKIPVYTVTFDATIGNPNPSNQSVLEGELAEEPSAPLSSTHNFLGWYEEGATEVFKFSTKIYKNVDLVAQWEIKKYPVSYDADGGSPTPSTEYVEHGERATKPTTDPIKAGHNFLGWYYADGSTTEHIFPFEERAITGPVKLVAKWEPINYTVTFDPTGGTPDPADQTVVYQKTATEPQDPQKDGHDFLGWYEVDAATSFDFKTEIEKNTDLIALWEAKSYTVTFIPNGGTFTGSQGTENEVVTVLYQGTVDTKDITNANHTFGGWKINLSDTTTFDFATQITEDITLIADWNLNQHSVTFDVNGGDNPPVSQVVDHGSTATEPTEAENPTRDNHGFIGWTTTKDGTEFYDFTSKVETSITLYAKWEIDTNTVTFDPNGGMNPPVDQTVNYGSVATEPTDLENPTRDNHSFIGWTETYDGTVAYNFATLVITDKTLYAMWEIDTNTVTFDPNGGVNPPADQIVDYGSTATEPLADENPTRNNYGFVGWSTTPNGTDIYDFKTPVTKEVTLYAVWEHNVYTVTFMPGGGSPTPEVQKVTHGNLAFDPGEITRPGHDFVEWQMEDRSAFDFSTPITSDLVLYARFTTDGGGGGGGGGGSTPDPDEPITIPDEEVPLDNIPDQEVPLDDLPDLPGPSTPDVVIEEEEVPLSNTPDLIIVDEEVPLGNLPITGAVGKVEATRTTGMLGIIAALGLIGFVAIRRRRKSEM